MSALITSRSVRASTCEVYRFGVRGSGSGIRAFSPGHPRTPNPVARSPYNHAMPLLNDWLDLGKKTVTSISTNDVTNLYSLEWPDTKKMLIAEHSADIEQDQNRVRRWAR